MHGFADKTRQGHPVRACRISRAIHCVQPSRLRSPAIALKLPVHLVSQHPSYRHPRRCRACSRLARFAASPHVTSA